MKLLDKKEVLQAKNLSRQLEINEGAKLAKKVDALRETTALEEKKLAEFRSATLKIIKLEVDELNNTKKVLLDEVDRLKQERIELRKPLDKEWKILNEEKEDLYTKQSSVDFIIKKLEGSQKIIAKEVADMLIEKERIADAKLQIIKKAEETEEEKQRISKLLFQAEEVREVAMKFAKEKLKEISLKEAEITDNERDLNNKKLNFEERVVEFNRRMALLVDREQALEREIKRRSK